MIKAFFFNFNLNLFPKLDIFYMKETLNQFNIYQKQIQRYLQMLWLVMEEEVEF